MSRDSLRIGPPTRPAETAARVVSIDTGIWIGVIAALLVLFQRHGLSLTLGQDSFQYLSVARNALDRQFGYTSLVHFDAERSFGVIPAPMVTFPSGYPLAIALASLTGLSLESAGLLISLLSMTACVPLLMWTSIRLGLPRLICNGILAGFVANAAVIVVAAKVASDALFTALVVLAIGLLAQRDRDKSALWGWSAAGIAFGLAYFTRYAAMFFVVGLAIVVARHLLASNWALAKRYGTTLAIASCAVLWGITRNIALVGNWRGGNDKIVSNPVSSVLLETMRGLNRLLLGPGSGVAGGTVMPRAALVLSFAFGLAWLIGHHLRRSAKTRPSNALTGTTGIGIDLSLMAMAYVACLVYAWIKSVISIGEERYLVPVLPLLLLLIGIVLQMLLSSGQDGARKLPFLAFAVSLVLYVYLNLLILRVPQQASWPPVAAALDAKNADGRSVRTVVHELTGADGALMANNGQTIGHLLARRTVSLVGPHFSSIEWNEQSVRDVARRFGVKAIVISIPNSADQWTEGDLVPSAFVKRLALGDAPSWMQLHFRSVNHLVFVPRLELQ